jgi:DNA-binding beta-propeller fold protein YncE
MMIGSDGLSRATRVLLLAVMSLMIPARQSAAQSYRVARQLPLGGAGGWDFVTVDTVGHRLFIARDNRVMVVDPSTGHLLGEISGLKGAQHVALAPSQGHGFITSGGDAKVAMFDLKTLKVLGKAPAAADADVIVYDPASNRIFSFNGTAKSVTEIDPASGKAIKTVPLPGLPEFAVADGAGHIFVNLANRGEIAELDSKRMRVTRRWSIAPCKEPTGLALDAAHQRLFSVCANKKMAISDAVAGRLLTTLPIGGGADAAAYDPATGNAFSSNGDGSVTVVHEDGPSAFRVIQTLSTMPGARTIALDPQSHRLYVVATAPIPSAAKRPGKQTGPFTLLVIER